MASQLDQLRSDLGEDYNQFTDEQLTKALHNQYQQDTGDEVDFEIFASEVGFSTLTGGEAKASDTINSPTELATAGEQQAPDVSQKLGFPETTTTIGQDLASFGSGVTEGVKATPALTEQAGKATKLGILAASQRQLNTIQNAQMVKSDLQMMEKQRRLGVKNPRPSIGSAVIGYDITKTDEFKKALDEYRVASKAARKGRPEDFAGGLGFDAVQMIEKLIPSLVVGAGTGTVPALGTLAAQVFTDTQSSMLERGLSLEQASKEGLVTTVIEVGTEVLPFSILLNKLGWSGVKKFIGYITAEGTSESVSSLLQSAWDKGHLNPDLTLSEALKEAGYEGLLGTIGGAAIVTPTIAAEKALEGSAQKQLGREMLAMVEYMDLTATPEQAVAAFAPPQNNAQAVYQQAVKDEPVVDEKVDIKEATKDLPLADEVQPSEPKKEISQAEYKAELEDTKQRMKSVTDTPMTDELIKQQTEAKLSNEGKKSPAEKQVRRATEDPIPKAEEPSAQSSVSLIEDIPDSTFSGDINYSLENAFRSGKSPDFVPLVNAGFAPEEITALNNAGLADNGVMSRKQWAKYLAEGSRRLAAPRKKTTPKAPETPETGISSTPDIAKKGKATRKERIAKKKGKAEKQPPKEGVQKVSTEQLNIKKQFLDIADEGLAKGEKSVTPDSPVEVDYNITTGEYELVDGYHRYLKLRGGSVKSALAQAKRGEFPDIQANVRLVHDVKRDGFTVTEPVKKEIREPEGTPYKNLKNKSRSDATPETDKMQLDLFSDLKKEARRGNLLASAINTELVNKGGYSIIGQKVTSPEDLATLAQNWRDPRWETMRYVFVKDGAVVGQTGVSQRLPSAATLFPGDQSTGWLSRMIKETGANGYWMLHNHPSGNPTPSQADKSSTTFLSESVSGFKGHIVINSNKYAVINAKAEVEVIKKEFGKDELLNPSKPSWALNMKVGSKEDVARIGKSYMNSETKDGWHVLIAANQTGVRGIMEIPSGLVSKNNMGRLKAQIRKFARQTGSGSVFMFSPKADIFNDISVELHREGFLRDIVARDSRGQNISFQATAPAAEKSFGIKSGEGAVEVAQDDNGYNVPEKASGATKLSKKQDGKVQSVWAPGATYVPMLRGQPITEVEGAKVPDKPIRREHIIKKIERLFGVKVSTGRVKGKRLGLFRPRTSEIRTKLKNDLEVTAHEFSHWLDDMHPAFKRAYRRSPFKQELLGVSYGVDDVSEGFAEFGRLYMTQESEAVERAPLFYDKFIEIMESEGIQTNVDDIKDSMHQWYNQGAMNRFRSKVGKQSEPIRQRIAVAVDGFSDKATAAILDQLHGVKVAEAELVGSIKDADLSAYKSLRIVAGARGVTKVVLEHATIGFAKNGDVIQTGIGLRQVFEPVADVFDDTMMYFAARRANELMKQGREHHFEQAEIDAALTLAEGKPEIVKAFDEYQAFNKRMMDFYQQAGLLDKQSRKAMEEMNKDYVPFFRIQEEITGDIITKRTPFKRLTGGTANVDDIFDNITFGTATLIQQALLNRAKQRTYLMLDETKGGAKYASRITTEIKMTEIERTQIEDAFLKGLGIEPKAYRKSQRNNTSDPSVDKMLGMIEGNLSDFVGFFTFGHAPQGNNIDSVMVDGKRVFFEVHDPLFMKAMNSFGAKPMKLALRIGAGFKNVLSRGVTSMPDFQLVNLLRDSFNGFALSQGGMKPVYDSVKGMYNKMMKDDAYWDFMANGGGYSSTIHGETQATRRHLEQLYNSHGIDYKTVLDTPKKVLDMWEEFTSAFEYGTRLAEYKAMRKKGASMQEAAFQGREVSTDFAMRGYSETLRVFTLTVPFMNARMQGLYRLEREAFEKGGKQSPFGDRAARLALRGMGALTIPSILLYLINRDDERYTSLPEWVKDLHWVILIPGVKDAYLIPKPFETGAIFATIPERMMQLSIEQNGQKFGDSMLRMFKDTFALDPTPQAMKPLLETEATNRKFTGAPIIPSDLEGIESWEQFRPYTSESMIQLGKETGLSPLKLEHWVRGYFGTLGMYLLMGSDGLVSDGFGGEPPTKRIDQLPVLRRFLRQQPYRGTSYSDEFYKIAKETRKITKTMNKIRKEGRAGDLNQYLGEENRELLFNVGTAVSDFMGEFSKINGSIRRIRRDKSKTGDAKRDEINDLLETRNKLFRAASEVLSVNQIKSMKKRVEGFK